MHPKGPKFNCWTHIAPSGKVILVAGRFRDFVFVKLPVAGRGSFVTSSISCCRSYILYENESGRQGKRGNRHGYSSNWPPRVKSVNEFNYQLIQKFLVIV